MLLEERDVIAALHIFLGKRPRAMEVQEIRLRCADWRDVFALIASTPEFKVRHPVFEQVLADVGGYVVTQLEGDDLRKAAREAIARTLSLQVAERLYVLAGSLRPVDQHESTLSSDLHRLLSRGE